MPGVRKRENRENQFYNVGEQGRKTGITLEDKGLRDEYGMEPVSGIFSSPEKSPPKRNAGQRRTDGTVTESESMDIQESTIPDLTPGHILRNSRTSLPPPRSRSPMKTSLGATPRRSLGPMARSPHKSSSPDNVEVGTEVNRRLDFLEQEESNVQETPVLSGSGPRRGAARRDIYDLEESPVPGNSMQEEDDAAANDEYDESAMLQLVQEDSFAGAVEANEVTEADAEEGSIQEDETVEEVVKQPAKRGRKRKSDALEPVAERESPRTSTRATRRQSAEKPGKQAAPSGKKPRGRPPLNKQATPPAEEEPSLATNATEEAEEEAGQPPKKRGRGRGARNQTEQDEAAEERAQSAEPEANKGRKRSKPGPNPGAKKPAADQSAFKKPGPKSKSKAPEKASDVPDLPPGRLVDTLGKPIDDVDRRSITTAGSRFSRARSIFCERKAEELGAVSRTGRRNIKPVDFWRNERAAYDKFGNLLVVRQNESVEPPPQKKAKKGRKKKAAPDEDDEGEELEDWEANEGVLVGTYRDYDPATETASDELLEAVIAWAPKGIVPAPVPNAQFKFTKLGSAGGRPFFSWGCIDLDEDDIKRSKNSRRMQMVFSITEGAAEVAVAENVFTVHKGGVWQVPRGNNYSIRNVAKRKTRIFFFQAMEPVVEEE